VSAVTGKDNVGKLESFCPGKGGLHQSAWQHVPATHNQPSAGSSWHERLNCADRLTRQFARSRYEARARVPTSLASDLAPDDLVGCAPFGAPIRRKFVN
jgi:hypothetical protein